jgi:hypothetical protein
VSLIGVMRGAAWHSAFAETYLDCAVASWRKKADTQ